MKITKEIIIQSVLFVGFMYGMMYGVIYLCLLAKAMGLAA